VKTPPLLVTDTHPLIYYMTAQFRRLPAKIKRAFDEAVDGRTAIYIPAVALWELSQQVKRGRVRLSANLDEYVKQNFFARAISVLDIETEDILQSHSLRFARDPYDILIVAMAQRIGCPLITGDRQIHEAKPCPLFWD
jgi:PIN domain nuclease of toxin-antitoxin system